MNPVMLIKIPFIQYLFGIRSMRQTISEIEVNVRSRIRTMMTHRQEGTPVGMGKKPVSAARAIQRADSPGKGNTNTFLLMLWRLPVTGTDGSSDIPSIPGMNMTAVPLNLYMAG